MNFIVHILSVLVLGKYLNLGSYEWLLAFIFGVLIDIDHLIKIPLFMKLKNSKTMRHLNWRTSFQEPIAFLWIIPLSVFLKSYIPLVFFTMHIILDYMMSYHKKPLFPFINFIFKDTKKFKRDGFIQAAAGLICIILLIL